MNGKHSRRRLITLTSLFLVLTITLAVPATPVSASVACSDELITINSNPGAEPPSLARGHMHRTGNHYVRYIYSDNVWEWWADNNGGSDGDTEDTFYGLIQC